MTKSTGKTPVVSQNLSQLEKLSKQELEQQVYEELSDETAATLTGGCCCGINIDTTPYVTWKPSFRGGSFW